MISVQVSQTSDGRITSFLMSGHADFAEHGSDIVCAGASAVAIGAVNSIYALTEVEPENVEASSGKLTCSIPNGIPEDQQSKVQLILQSMVVSLQSIEEQYSKYIKINFQ